MSQILKQSTAFTFRLGPFVDSTDGNTQENSLTIAYTDVLLSKAGGALAAKNETTALTGTGANAHYTCVMNTTDTKTLGALRVWCHISASALPVWQDFIIVPAEVYNSLVAGLTGYISLADLKAQAENALTAYAPLKTSVSGRLIDVSAGGEAGVDWANVGSPTTTLNLSNTKISQADILGSQALTDIKSRMESVINAYEPAKISVSGRLMDVSANGNVGIDWNNIDAPTTTQNLSGTTISAVSGAAGSVTGDVGGNVIGSVGSLDANAINNNALHSNACAKISDSGIQRGAANWENNSDDRSLGWAISKLVNKLDLNAAGDTLTIRKSNDSTALFTQAVTTSGGAAPVTALDTA